MKKYFAILLLTIHAFNLGGYTLLFGFLQQQNNISTTRQIENGDYSDKDLILVKVPMSLPYGTNWKEYERYDGEIEWGGTHYNYVKRKLQNDTLYVLCLPNETQTKLQNAKKQYSNHVNDMPTQKKADPVVKKSSLSGDYVQNEITHAYFGIPHPEQYFYFGFSSSLLSAYIHCIIQPPDAITA